MKQELIELIEAYAAAKAVNNARLAQIAATEISAFIEKIDVVLIPVDESTEAAQAEVNKVEE